MVHFCNLGPFLDYSHFLIKVHFLNYGPYSEIEQNIVWQWFSPFVFFSPGIFSWLSSSLVLLWGQRSKRTLELYCLQQEMGLAAKTTVVENYSKSLIFSNFCISHQFLSRLKLTRLVTLFDSKISHFRFSFWHFPLTFV